MPYIQSKRIVHLHIAKSVYIWKFTYSVNSIKVCDKDKVWLNSSPYSFTTFHQMENLKHSFSHLLWNESFFYFESKKRERLSIIDDGNHLGKVSTSLYSNGVAIYCDCECLSPSQHKKNKWSRPNTIVLSQMTIY